MYIITRDTCSTAAHTSQIDILQVALHRAPPNGGTRPCYANKTENGPCCTV
jgi:hypothetical protein